MDLHALRLRLRALFQRTTVEAELDEEIRDHLERETEKNVREGMDPAEARRRARAAFGPVTATRESHREAHGCRWVEDAIGDTRIAWRTLARSPSLTVAAVVTLALGIGANTAIFSAVNAVMLRPLPFTEPDRLVMLWEENAERNWHQADAAPANVLDWKEQVESFEDVAAYPTFTGSTTLTGEGAPVLLKTVDVTGNFFSLLGVPPALGRVFRDAETWRTGASVAVLSDRIWRSQFGARPDIVGRRIVLDGQSVEVAGVLPRSFAYPGLDMDVWRPMNWDPDARARPFFRRAHWLRGVARLKPGVSLPAADVQLQAVIHRLQSEYPATNTNMGGGLSPLHPFLVGDARRPLLVLLAAVATLLAIACANVGNLLLVRAAGREREAAVRLALGANRGRLIRQAIAESLVLSVLGGTAGLALGWWGTRALVAVQPGMLDVRDIGLNLPVLGYVFLVTILSGLLFGIAPALWNRRRAPAEALKQDGRSGLMARRGRRWTDALVIVEVALALMLTTGAGLLVRSFWHLRGVEAGFDAENVLTASIGLPSNPYDSGERIEGFFSALVDRARTLPGVTSSAAVSRIPLDGPPWSSDFSVEGRAPSATANDVVHREITPGYTTVMRVPLVRGRLFDERDRTGAPLAVLVNQALVDRYFPGENPIGLRVAFDRPAGPSSAWRTIVGVVGNERQSALAAEPRPEFLAPLAQDNNRSRMTLVVRTAGDPALLAPGVRAAVSALDPNLAITSLETMTSVRAESLARQRFLAMLLLLFAIVGLSLAVVGVYGVMAQIARQRMREMAVRIALGAGRAEVQRMVVRRALTLVGPGLVLGLAASLATGGLMRSLIHGITPADPLTLAAVATLLVVSALVAAWLPAFQASRTDPATILRSD